MDIYIYICSRRGRSR